MAKIASRIDCSILMMAGVSALAVFVFFFNLGSYRTLTTHEGFLAAVPAREMLATGDWLVPRFGGIEILTRPPLAYWTVASLGWLYGEVNEWVARLPAALAGLALVGLMGLWGSRWYGRKIGIYAALVQATSVYMIMQARLAEADMLLCLLTTSALYLSAGFLIDRPESGGPVWRSPVWIAVYTLLGASALAKEFIGPILGLMPVVLFLLIERRPRCLRYLASPIGLALFALLAGAWPLRVGWEFPELWTIWYNQTIGRSLGNWDREPIWFYVVTVPWLVLPWTPITLVAVPPSWQAAWRRADRRERFLWIWFLSHILLLTLSVGKHKHHAIPALPALTLITARGLDLLIVSLRESKKPVLNALSAILGGLLWTVVCGGAALVIAVKWPEMAFAAAVTAVLCALGGLVAVWSIRAGRYRRAALMVLAVFLAGYVSAAGWLLPGRDPRRPAVEFARNAAATLPPEGVIVVYGLGWTPVIFYLDRRVVREETIQGFTKRLGAEKRLYVLTARTYLAELGRVGKLRRIDEMRGASRNDSKNHPLLVLAEITHPARS